MLDYELANFDLSDIFTHYATGFFDQLDLLETDNEGSLVSRLWAKISFKFMISPSRHLPL